jgi:hypothetical protein
VTTSEVLAYALAGHIRIALDADGTGLRLNTVPRKRADSGTAVPAPPLERSAAPRGDFLSIEAWAEFLTHVEPGSDLDQIAEALRSLTEASLTRTALRMRLVHSGWIEHDGRWFPDPGEFT